MNQARQRVDTDILILGPGVRGCSRRCMPKRANPELDVTIAVKGLLGKCGCTRMVQGGYNVALAPGNSVERHFMDTIEGGGWSDDQELAWPLVTQAPKRIRELENQVGCFFDREPDGTIHQKAFAGQTFDRTVHKGDLTGIEIVGRLADQMCRLGVPAARGHARARLRPRRRRSGLAGVLMLDMRSARRSSCAPAKRWSPPAAGDDVPVSYALGRQAGDGMAMALRAGLALRDMEITGPTGLLAGAARG